MEVVNFLVYLYKNRMKKYNITSYQQVDTRRDEENKEAAKERVCNDCRDDREQVGATIGNIRNLSSINTVHIKFFYKIDTLSSLIAIPKQQVLSPSQFLACYITDTLVLLYVY